MSEFMQIQIFKKGRVYSADCSKCGMTHFIHEWITDSFNDDRDAMQSGRSKCPECRGKLDPDTFWDGGRQYAGRYSAPGYRDCTDWHYGRNRRKLERELRDLYGN